MQNKLNKAILLIVAVAIGLMSTRLLFTLIPQKEAKISTYEGISYIEKLNSSSTSKKKTTAQKPSSKKGEKSSRANKKNTESPIIKDGNFKAAFNDIIISGDSLVKAINEYGILDSSQVIAEIGVGTKYLEKTTDEIVKASPKYLILHYGENELDEKENAKYFVARYKKCIETLKKKLPDTAIYVDSIFPVLDKAHKSEPYTVNIDYYNELLKEMTKEVGVHYLDFTPLWKNADKNYYDADGIHPLSSFYTEQYLPYVYTEVKS